MPASRPLALVCKGVMTLGIALATLMLAAPAAQAQLRQTQAISASTVTGPAVLARGGCSVPPCPVGIVAGPPTPPGGPRPFDFIGAIQAFTVSAPGNLFSGGSITVNGITIVIPTNLVMTLPANYLTVGQLFAQSPIAGRSALALNDLPAPIAAYEASISGNIVNGVYIAGLVGIAQQSLNTASGVIKAINYTTGALCVGAAPGACLSTDARVVINDPSGRYGLANGVGGKAAPDARFAVDADNPTIHAASGYPMCVPRVAPPAVDPRCPSTNRPGAAGAKLPTFVMSPAALVTTAPFPVVTIPACGAACNANEQAPLELGDTVIYSGILARDAVGTYVAAYSIEASVGIFTPPGATFYMFLDAPLLGVGPAVCPGNAECQARLRTSIFVTDPSAARAPIMYSVDESLAGTRTSRVLPSTLVNTAQVGRYVFSTDKDIQVFGGIGGAGATREIIARVAGVANGTAVNYGPAPAAAVANTANGLVSGQYVSPVGEYIFPEPNIGGGVLTPYNFRCLAFLANGWGEGGGLPGIGRLTPFPEATAPAGVNCSN
ncbi:hypothetical protein [Polaromonas sp.]|uniref:hypothetical protein n=1 Tax=Polaromonas sp. TaxID=1869339 RepID=UPI00179C0732|nr:hypothetical protein [Polaromonas sp.]NMM07956.1 hypothetical protein [Polaromonas sp.]